MKIAIIGAGMVGGTLGSRFAEKGHEIHFGVPHPKKSENQELVARIGNNARVGTVAEAPKDAEIVLLAVHTEVIEDALKNCGDLSGKILVNSTNPLAKDGNSLFLTVGFDGSGAEQIAKLAKGAKVVKCF